MKDADLIVHRRAPIESESNKIAIDLIVQNLEKKLLERGFKIEDSVTKVNKSQIVCLNQISKKTRECIKTLEAT